MAHPAIKKVIETAGLSGTARAVGVTYQAVRKWEAAGRLPRTEWTGETQYAQKLSGLTSGAVSVDELLQRHTPDEKAAADMTGVLRSRAFALRRRSRARRA